MNLLNVLTCCFVISHSIMRASAVTVTAPRPQLSNVTTTNNTYGDVKVTDEDKTRYKSQTKASDIALDKHKQLDEDYSQEDDYESELSSEELGFSRRINEQKINTNMFFEQTLKDKDKYKDQKINETVIKNKDTIIDNSEITEFASKMGNNTNTNMVIGSNSYSTAVNSPKQPNPLKQSNADSFAKNKFNITDGLPRQNIIFNRNETLPETLKNFILLKENQTRFGLNTRPRDPMSNTRPRDPMSNKTTNRVHEDQNQQQSKHETNPDDKENVQNKEVLNSNRLSTSPKQPIATQYTNKDAQNVTYQDNNSSDRPSNNSTLLNNSAAQNGPIKKFNRQNVTFQNNDAQNGTIQKNYAQNVTFQNNDGQIIVPIKKYNEKNFTFQNNDAQNDSIKKFTTFLNKDAQNVMIQNDDARNGTIEKVDARNGTFQSKEAQNATLQHMKPIFSTESSAQKNEKPFQRPHILFIVADDLGWGDVSLHGSDHILTPNLDMLAYTGVLLTHYYTDVQGTASRSALFTGKYPLRLGTQGDSIRAWEDRGIPVTERLLPSYLRDLGYSTHLVGKWDVGKSRLQYLPTARGFDTFYGFLGSAADYYTYDQIEECNGTSYFGCALFNGTEPVEDQQGYLTDVITNRALQIIRDHNTMDSQRPMYLHVSHLAPHAGGGLVTLQAPAADIHANQHIAHSARRIYAGMVTNLDNSIGSMIAALSERDMLDNTLIVFVSDNGAPTATGDTFGSNLPLRGTKRSPWEGAARTTGVVWKQSLTSRTFDRLFHVTDWLPTLISAAGANGNVDETLDGLDQWHAVVSGSETGGGPQRTDVLVSIEDHWAALRDGHFKVIVGELKEPMCAYTPMEYQRLRQKPPLYENVLVQSKTFKVFKESLNLTLNIDEALAKRRQFEWKNQMLTNNSSDYCIPNKDKGCLYNITSDPLESVDLWGTYPDIVRRLTLRLRTIWTELQPRARAGRDVRADPALHNYVWTPWVQVEDVTLKLNTSITTAPNLSTVPLPAPPFPLQVSLGEIQYLVDLNLNMFRQTVFDSIQTMGNQFIKTVNGLF